MLRGVHMLWDPVIACSHTSPCLCMQHVLQHRHNANNACSCFLTLCGNNIPLDAPFLSVAAYLTSDCVMASKAHTMQSTIEYMNRKYGSAAGYVKVIGITPTEVSQIRLNMLIKAAPRDLLERLSMSNNARGRSPGGSPAHSLHRRTVSGDGVLNGSMDGSKNDRFDSSSLSAGGNRTRHVHSRSLARRSKTMGSLSRRSKDFPNSLETTSKLPEDILINRRVTDVK